MVTLNSRRRQPVVVHNHGAQSLKPGDTIELGVITGTEVHRRHEPHYAICLKFFSSSRPSSVYSSDDPTPSIPEDESVSGSESSRTMTGTRVFTISRHKSDKGGDMWLKDILEDVDVVAPTRHSYPTSTTSLPPSSSSTLTELFTNGSYFYTCIANIQAQDISKLTRAFWTAKADWNPIFMNHLLSTLWIEGVLLQCKRLPMSMLRQSKEDQVHPADRQARQKYLRHSWAGARESETTRAKGKGFTIKAIFRRATHET